MLFGFIGREAEADEHIVRSGECRGLGGEGVGAAPANTAEFHAKRGEALISIVGTQFQAIFGPGRKHPIGFSDAARDEIINHDAGVAFGS